METTEVLIAGAGVIGSSIAYHLARARRRVLVVDRAGIAEAPAASWASAGGVRRQGRDPAEALLASGAIGAPRQLEAWFGFPPLDAGNIRRRAALGGGALNDAAGYTLHAARRLFGREPRVLAGRRFRSTTSEVDERGVALLEIEPGLVGQVAYGWGHAYRNAYTIWGSEARLSLERAFSVPPS